jgi:hypothetical protein
VTVHQQHDVRVFEETGLFQCTPGQFAPLPAREADGCEDRDPERRRRANRPKRPGLPGSESGVAGALGRWRQCAILCFSFLGLYPTLSYTGCGRVGYHVRL